MDLGKVLSAQRLINQIALRDSWPLQNGDGEEILPLFYNMISTLEDDEIDLVVELSNKLQLISIADYVPIMKQALTAIPNLGQDGASNVLLLPLITKDQYHKGELKSGHAALQAMRSVTRKLAPFQGTTIKMYRSVFEAPENEILKANTVIFIDDFIGSGETASSALSDYFYNYHDGNRLVILASVCMHMMSIDTLRDLPIYITSGRLVEKGITDNGDIIDKEHAMSVMRGICRGLRVRGEYQYGYAESEALVNMHRCPNNTFPVFWCDKNSRGEPREVPFPR